MRSRFCARPCVRIHACMRDAGSAAQAPRHIDAGTDADTDTDSHSHLQRGIDGLEHDLLVFGHQPGVHVRKIPVSLFWRASKRSNGVQTHTFSLSVPESNDLLARASANETCVCGKRDLTRKKDLPSAATRAWCPYGRTYTLGLAARV